MRYLFLSKYNLIFIIDLFYYTIICGGREEKSIGYSFDIWNQYVL